MTTAANTPTTYYIDSAAVKKACADDFKKIDKACAPEEEKSDKNKHPVLKKMLGAPRVQALENMANKAKGAAFVSTKDNAWLSHCDGLWIKPGSADVTKEFNSLIKDFSGDLGQVIEKQVKPLVESLGNEVKDRAIAAAKEQALKAGGRSAARWGVGLGGAAVGGVGAIVTEAVATAWNVYDGINTGIDAYKLGKEAYGSIKELGTVLEVAQKAQAELAVLAGDMTGKSPTDMMATGMGVLSRMNACTRARRCKLVPYKDTQNPAALGGKGCCPGQSGHHVLPDQMTKDGNCPGYERDNAPTVCAEGTNGSNGTHGALHKSLVKGIESHKSGLGGLFGKSLFSGDTSTISYGKARDLGINSVHKTFPESKCDEKCLRAQLDAYYKDKCTKVLPAVAGTSGSGQQSGATKTK